MIATCHRAGGCLVVGALLILTSGCATYSHKMVDLRPHLAAGNFAGALAVIEEETGSKDMLLRYLEQGLILHYSGLYDESNAAFEAAERTADDLYTKSLSEGAIAFITNDQSNSYRARPYEMAMVPYYRALNYVYLGQRQDALVEGRKASELLARYVDATLTGLDEDDSAFEQVRSDAFLLHLSGMLYDWGGETNAAFIAYRNAAAAYQKNADLLGLEIPSQLAGDLERTGAALGFGNEVERLREIYPAVFAQAPAAAPPADETGELVLFLETGWVPRKIEQRLDLPIMASDDPAGPDFAAVLAQRVVVTQRTGRRYQYDRTISIALPALETRADRLDEVWLATAGRRIEAKRVQNFAGLARVTFDAEYWKILLKTVARVLTKDTAVQKTENKVARLALDIFTSATERADTRSWMTLPAEIQLVRLRLPAGVHNFAVEIEDPRGQVRDRFVVRGVEVRAGDWTFLNHRDFQGAD